MRISDWISDLCSSDLTNEIPARRGPETVLVARLIFGIEAKARREAVAGAQRGATDAVAPVDVLETVAIVAEAGGEDQVAQQLVIGLQTGAARDEGGVSERRGLLHAARGGEDRKSKRLSSST